MYHQVNQLFKGIDKKENFICMMFFFYRFSRFTPVPLDLISSCIDCLKCVAKMHPKQVWHSMKQTGLLPYLTGNVDNYAEVVR